MKGVTAVPSRLAEHDRKAQAPDHKVTLLVLTRKYPPVTGGMERVSYELTTHLAARVELVLVKFSKKSDGWVPLVYLLFFLRTVLVMAQRRVDAIYLTDAVLAPLGVVLRVLYRAKVFVIVHGLDITFANHVFQRIVPPAVAKLDKVICVSSATRRACLQRGVPAHKTIVIPNGANDYFAGLSREESRSRLGAALGMELGDEFLILSVGRLVERKGFHWFVERVMPEVLRKRPNARYFVVGGGPLADRMRRLTSQRGLEDHVFVFSEVDNRLLGLFYNSADVFVAPNITVAGDMEGFGIVLLEAGSCDLPVVGSDIEGISEVLSGFGHRVPEGDTVGFADAVLGGTRSRRTRDYVIENYSWPRVAEKHFDIIAREVS